MKKIMALCDPQVCVFTAKVREAAEAAYNNAELSEGEAQRIIDAPGLTDALRFYILDNRRPREADCEYPEEYKPLPVEEQVVMLANIFQLDPSQALGFAKNLPQLPEGEGAESWFAWPSEDALARQFFHGVKGQGERHCRAIQLIYEKISVSRPFFVYYPTRAKSVRMRINTRTAEAMDEIARQQKGDIQIAAAQLGKRYAGLPNDVACGQYTENEFGLTNLAFGSIVLTHPKRFTHLYQLHVYCPGDEVSEILDNSWDMMPCYYFSDTDGALVQKFVVRDVGNRFYGTATGFFTPQS